MAQKGHVKVIKNDTGNGGGISLGSGSGSTSGTTSGAVGSVGSVGSAPASLATVAVTITAENSGVDLDFNIPFHTAMLLNVGDLVRFEVINGKRGTPDIPVYVERIPSGVVASINPDGASGIINERISSKPIAFYQSHLAELGIKVGDNVKYTLIYTSSGEMAVNVQES